MEIKVEVQSFVPFHRVDVVYNGHVVTSREERAGTREMILKEQIRVPGSGWLAARCFSRLSWPSWFSVAAHTSPVYLVKLRQELLTGSSASYLLNLIDGAESYVQNLAIRPDPERFERVLKVFREARSELHRRMHLHGIQH